MLEHCSVVLEVKDFHNATHFVMLLKRKRKGWILGQLSEYMPELSNMIDILVKYHPNCISKFCGLLFLFRQTEVQFFLWNLGSYITCSDYLISVLFLELIILLCQVYTPSKISTDCYTSELFSHVYPWILFLCHRSSHQYMFVQKLLTLVSFVSSGSENYMPPRLWGGSCCCYACYHSICIKGGKCFKGTTLFFFFLV